MESKSPTLARLSYRASVNPISRVWNVVKEVRIGMLTTRFNGSLRSQPLEARVDRDTVAIWFVTDARSAKTEEINVDDSIGLTFTHEDNHVFLSITGRAFMTRDITKARNIWRTTDDSWFPDGPDDPNVRVLRVEPITAELWDGPSSVAAVTFEYTTH